MTSLTIAIPTFRSPAVLANCIASLFMNTDVEAFDTKVVIVNNGVDPITTVGRGHSIEIHDQTRNLGWMGGVNFALDRCETDYFCMMNDDLLFIPGGRDFWNKLITVAEVDSVGLVGPSSNFISGYQNAWYHTPWRRIECGYLIGMLALTDTSLLQEWGGLDESLPGGDDLDLSLRIRAKGYQLVAVRDAYVHHIGSQTGRREQPDYWDSPEHQAKTYNAIMKKHGVKAYWDMINWSAREWKPSPPTAF